MKQNLEDRLLEEQETKSEMAVVQTKQVYEANMGYLTFYVVAIVLSMLQLGYILAANNQVQLILDVQFGITDQWQKNLYHSLIGSSAVLGSSIGSAFGGLIKHGRRRIIIINNVICAICIIPTLFLNIYSICIGRFLFGLCGGIYQVCIPRMLEETVPSSKLGQFGISINLAVNAGKMLSLVIGAGVPLLSDVEAVATTNYWRIVFAVPWIMIAMQLCIFLFVIKEDTIKFSIDTKKDEDAMNQIRKVYKNPEEHKEILQHLKQTGSCPQHNKVPFMQALFGEDNWRASWYCFVLVVLTQLCGQNAILLYSSTILQRMYNPEDGGISPKTGTMLIGIVTFTSAFAAIFPVKHFPRKVLFVGGHGVLGILLTLLGFCAYLKLNTGVLIMMLLMLACFQQSVGPLTWIYVTEIASDQGLGFAMLSYKAALLLVSSTSEFMMDSPLTPAGVFWMFAAFTTIGCIFHFAFMRETKHLNDKEKKSLYKSKVLEQTPSQKYSSVNVTPYRDNEIK